MSIQEGHHRVLQCRDRSMWFCLAESSGAFWSDERFAEEHHHLQFDCKCMCEGRAMANSIVALAWTSQIEDSATWNWTCRFNPFPVYFQHGLVKVPFWGCLIYIYPPFKCLWRCSFQWLDDAAMGTSHQLSSEAGRIGRGQTLWRWASGSVPLKRAGDGTMRCGFFFMGRTSASFAFHCCLLKGQHESTLNQHEIMTIPIKFKRIQVLLSNPTQRDFVSGTAWSHWILPSPPVRSARSGNTLWCFWMNVGTSGSKQMWFPSVQPSVHAADVNNGRSPWTFCTTWWRRTCN